MLLRYGFLPAHPKEKTRDLARKQQEQGRAHHTFKLISSHVALERATCLGALNILIMSFLQLDESFLLSQQFLRTVTGLLVLFK